MQTGFIDVANGQLFYQTHGEGNEDIVWVHGLPLNSDCWYAQFEYFQSAYRNIAVDLRGYGRSSEIPAGTDNITDLYVSDLLSLIHNLNLRKPILVGFASGGHATLRLAANHSDVIRQLILINASPCFMKKDDWEWGFDEASLNNFIEQINSAHSPIELSDLIFTHAMQERAGSELESLRTWFEDMLSKAKKETILGFFDNIANDDDRHLLKNITAPTLVLSSMLDLEVPPAVGLYMKQHMQQAQLVELNDIDQFAFATQSSLVNRLIEQFINPDCSICIPAPN